MHLARILKAVLLYSIVSTTSARPIHDNGGKDVIFSLKNKRVVVAAPKGVKPLVYDHPSTGPGNDAALTNGGHIGEDTTPEVPAQTCASLKARSWTEYLVGMVSKRMCGIRSADSSRAGSPTTPNPPSGPPRFDEQFKNRGYSLKGITQDISSPYIKTYDVKSSTIGAGAMEDRITIDSSLNRMTVVTATNALDTTPAPLKASLAEIQMGLWTGEARKNPAELASIRYETVVEPSTDQAMMAGKAVKGDTFTVTSRSTGGDKLIFDQLAGTVFGKSAAKMSGLGVNKPITSFTVNGDDLIVVYG